MKIYEKIYCSVWESGKGYKIENETIDIKEYEGNSILDIFGIDLKEINKNDYHDFICDGRILEDDEEKNYYSYSEFHVIFEDENENILHEVFFKTVGKYE